jgi:ABC-type nitrate/sulfonate/bicarbonate transport system ATPase subunit
MKTLMNTVTQPLQDAIAHQSDAFLTIDNVCKIYPLPKNESYTVLEDVNLTVHQGEFICLIGHSGCGKSTLLNMVSGFAKPTYGEVRLQGKTIESPGPDRMVVFQGYALLPWLSVFDNVYLAVNAVYPKKSKAEKSQIVKEHLAMVGLTEAADKTPPQISGGMKQRVAIARALSIRPELLILDVLMITHDIDEALFLADRLVMMTNGPAANIGEVIKIPFKRPRDRSRIMETPEYYKLRNYALDFLYNRFAHDVD